MSEKPAVRDHGKPELAGWCPELTALAGSTGMNVGVRARELVFVKGNREFAALFVLLSAE